METPANPNPPEATGVPPPATGSAEVVRVCFATIRPNAKYGNQLIAFHDAPPEPEEGVSVVRARVRYANNGNIRLWEILPNAKVRHGGPDDTE